MSSSKKYYASKVSIFDENIRDFEPILVSNKQIQKRITILFFENKKSQLCIAQEVSNWESTSC